MNIKAKKLLLCIFVGIISFVVIFFAYYCFELYCYREYRPSAQKNTEWVSEDGTVRFKMPQSGQAIGVLHTQKGDIDILVGCYIGETRMVVSERLSGDTLSDENILENWYGTHYRKNEFTVIVDKTTFFKKGDKIKFQKIS